MIVDLYSPCYNEKNLLIKYLLIYFGQTKDYKIADNNVVK